MLTDWMPSRDRVRRACLGHSLLVIWAKTEAMVEHPGVQTDALGILGGCQLEAAITLRLLGTSPRKGEAR